MTAHSTIPLIDTHAHILPFWDDGADSWETALAMVKQAEEDGIVEAVCTPHILSKQEFQQESILLGRFEELSKRVKEAGLHVRLYMGSEIFIHPELDLQYRIATPAGNGRYFLVEFPMSLTPESVTQSFLNEIFKAKIPVIAHPERYLRILNNPTEAYRYVERGALLQLNAGSILGNFGQMIRELSHFLLDANLVHLVASDAHDVHSRPLRLRKAFDYVSHKWSEDKARQLFNENPAKMLRGDVIRSEPKPPQQKTKTKWGRYMKSFTKKMGTFNG
ncbi:hypothetical protein JXO59_08955 [candidate division KSB1 bacterium]|nr:hypothetical protein [candidate division KSB1 bacterium]